MTDNNRRINRLSAILYRINCDESAQRILEELLFCIGFNKRVDSAWLDGMLDALWYVLDTRGEAPDISRLAFTQTLRHALTDEPTD